MTDTPHPPALPTTMALIDDMPLSLMIYQPDGMLVAMNRYAEQFWGTTRAAAVGMFNILHDPQSVAQGVQALFERVLQGERIEAEPVIYNTVQSNVARTRDQEIWSQATLFPLTSPDGSVCNVVIMHRDVTAQVAQVAKIASQREAITLLSTPVVQVWDGILTVPLVGIIDSYRASVITENLLNAIVRYSADVVILDVTGVPVVDMDVANYLLVAARSARLLGSQVALVGIKSEIAQTLVQLGLDLSYLVTRADLKAGVAWAFERQGLQVAQVATR